MRKRVGILISGRGSNMLSLVAATRSNEYPAEIALVLSNNPGAPGLALAGTPTAAIDHRPYRRDRAAHEAAIAEKLDEAGVEIVCLAGYMRLLSPFLVQRYAGRMLNIHPSLLPAFPGLDTHARALAAGVKLHGCTVHLVTDTMDEGPILAQSAIPVLPGDTEETLAARVLAQEHILYPHALRLHITGEAPAAPPGAFTNPLPAAPSVT
jgi:formyltetrahydrofolate-dependent phosphoribosylglycinamide formyltransferase